MDLEEVENKYRQYMQLWILYADISIELRKKSGLSKESAVNACRVYGPYITDILHQVEEVIKLFSMEKELRNIRNRGEFPVPRFTPDNNLEFDRDSSTLKLEGTTSVSNSYHILPHRHLEKTNARKAEESDLTHSKTDKPEITTTMATENAVGVQTRAMTEAQRMENEAQR